jgi:hypothetical protein
MAHLVKKYFATQLHVKLDHRIFATSLYLGMKASHSHGKADYIGILGSVLCIIHCLLMPALAFGSSYASHHEHAGMLSLDYFFILINGIAVYYATRNHKSIPVRIILWGALVLFSTSLILEGKHIVFAWLGYAGSALLIIGHLLNLYICQIAPRLKVRVS